MTIDEPGYFERLARVEAGHWWSLAMWDLASAWLREALRGRSGLTALDIGCGSGLSLTRIAGLREVSSVVGLEPDEQALRLARRQRDFEIIQGSMLELPFDHDFFDVITCFDVLQHLPERGDGQAIAEIGRVMKPGGVAIVRSNSSGFGPGRSSGGSAYRLRELIEMISGQGLQVCRASYANGLPALAQEIKGRLRFLGGSAASKWRAHPSGGGLRLDVPSPGINRLMGAVSSFEQRAAQLLRCPIPFGHSTMILARKPGGQP
jgi:SAM-dependent methyltransferase